MIDSILTFFIKLLLSIYILLNSKFEASQNGKLSNVTECRRPFRSESNFGRYQHFAISADSPYCASHGRDILRRNGSIVDAAVATVLCNGLVNMHSLGIGGGFIMVLYKASEGKAYVLDSREVAPKAAHRDMFVNLTSQEKNFGPLAIAIPGELKGLHEAWKKFGSLPWSDLFNRSIEMARHGIIVSPTLEKEIIDIGPMLDQQSRLRKLLFNSTAKRFKRRGEVIKRKELARFLMKAAHSPENFAEDIAADLRDLGSHIELDELHRYEPVWREAIRMHVRRGPIYNEDSDFLLHAAPPPSSGVLIGLALNMMSKYNYSKPEDKLCGNSSLYYHRMLETFKFLFAKRSYLSDMSFMEQPTIELMKNLTTLHYADYLQSKISDVRTYDWGYYGSIFDTPLDVGTSHTSLLAENGDALSLTSTINARFGSQLIGSRTGILFNNQMVDFATPNASDSFHLPPATPNFIAPGKRPMSSVSPVIFTFSKNNSVKLVVGASGGSLIITSVAMTSLAHLHLGMDIKSSIDGHRLHHQLLPNHVNHDSGFPKEILSDLKRYGHVIDERLRLSSVQGISKTFSTKKFKSGIWSVMNVSISANADYRKGGLDAGV